ncbi:von Willebrand domain-containing protein [Phanerochaete sordida]|uniref:von Willebrand domain-containing protein n=1 Tax=Phanerochaete sordida TaxID=48140 RepID=A0A9P3GE58_9APHY|nr:von Willebrand domain-containing protein [Phanerochaete sordida]
MQLTSTNRPCGIVHIQQNLAPAYVPLQKAEVHADVVDVSAIVTVTQYFWQSSPGDLPHAKYIFPVPARAAVCGFQMTAENGTVIKAVAKEREEARKQYEDAVQEGQTAGLVEHIRDDVFSISLGALPSNKEITTTITYVLDLMNDDSSDQVRLQIPMYVGTRHGSPPPGTKAAKRVPPHRVSISADVRMQGVVRSVFSPTHPTLTISDDGSAATSRQSQYLSKDFLTQDFVLCVAVDGLDAPRCIAERAPSGALAIQLNVVPNFDLPPVASQEYIFLVDRSYSMQGSRIETARNALIMLLRALPSQGTHVNIFSFGRVCDSLWPNSVVYDEEALEFATQHVDSLRADYGPGTKIPEALEKVFASRRTDKPTACFVLTDGEAWNFEGTMKVVDNAMKAVETTAPLRTFTLGIGSTTSTEMCEGIARAGNGICLMATTTESIVGKCAKLVRASRTYILKNVNINWGIPVGEMSEGSTIRQAPATVAAIYSGHRFIVSALVEDADSASPTEVVLSGQRDGLGDVIACSVPVKVVDFPADHPRRGLIPILAARRLIMDLDDASLTDPSLSTCDRILALGTTYQLASRLTAFVAVDTRTDDPVALAIEHLDELSVSDDGPATRGKRQREAEVNNAKQIADAYNRYKHAVLGAASTPAVPVTTYNSGGSYSRGKGGKGLGKGGAMRPTAVARRTAGRPGTRQRSCRKPPADTPSLPSSSASGPVEEPPAKRVHIDDDDAAVQGQVGRNITVRPEVLVALVRLQAFDGSFPTDGSLVAIVGGAALDEAKDLHVDEKVWATLLAVAFLQNHMQDRDLRDGLAEKAMEYVAKFPDVDAEKLLVRARELV